MVLSHLKPALWAVCNYPAGGGGANAFHGVSRHFAMKTALELRPFDTSILKDFKTAVQTVTDNMPSRLRLEPGSGSLRQKWGRRDRAVKQAASELFFESHGGEPAAILTSFLPGFTREQLFLNNPDTVAMSPEAFVASQLDIMAWNAYLPDGFEGLAPHSQSEDVLTKEAEKFHSRLKGDGKVLTAIILADLSSYEIEEKFSELITASPDTRFLLSSSPRYTREKFVDFCDKFRALLNPEQRKNLITYNFHTDGKDANPYKAALTLADHMIIAGGSESMVSDRLFAGRTAHYCYGYKADVLKGCFGRKLLENGAVKYFPLEIPLITEHFPSIDSTAMIGDQLVKNYEEHRTLIREINPDPALIVMKNRIKAALPVANPL